MRERGRDGGEGGRERGRWGRREGGRKGRVERKGKRGNRVEIYMKIVPH